MKQATIILIVILLTGCAHKPFDGWNTRDKILFGSFAVLKTVDILQTRELMKDGNGYEEKNPCLDGLGRDGATVAMVGGYFVAYLLANYVPKWRTPILVVFNVTTGLCVINNHSIGVRIRF